jgi:DNA-binding XRE family transcriptional regulator
MPNIARVLKDEILRLARKEVRVALKATKAECVALKKQVRLLKDKLAAMEKAGRQRAAKVLATAAGDAADAGDQPGMRFTSKAVRSLRMRLGLSQKDMGQLASVSAQAVYLWESKGSKLRLRHDTREALLKLKSMGRREVAKLLADESK